MNTKFKTEHFHSNTKELLPLVQKLKSDFPHLILLDIFARENRHQDETDEKGDFFLEYRFLDIDGLGNINITVVVEDGRYIPSISPIFPNATWCEREAREMFGIDLQEDAKIPLLTSQTNMQKSFPFRSENNLNQPWGPFSVDKNFFRPRSIEQKNPANFYQWKVLGPFLAWPNGPTKLMMDVDEDIIKQASIEVGFSHRALEKKLEGQSACDIAHYLERISYLTPHYGSFLTSHFFETLFDIKIPERAQALRMAILEMSRVLSHCSALENLFSHLEQQMPLTVVKWARAKCLEIFFEFSSGQNFNQLIIVGGLKRDLPNSLTAKCLTFVRDLKGHLETLESSLKCNQVWLAKTQLVPLDHRLGLQYGVLGTNIRASGINLDFRKRTTPYFYGEVDFEVPLGVAGTIYDRSLVRIEEVKQSLRIISQVLDHVPVGDVLNDSADRCALSMKSHRAMVEGPEGPLMLEIYFTLHSENATMHDLRIERFRFLSGSYMAAQCFPHILKERDYESVLPALYSFNINFSEVDR